MRWSLVMYLLLARHSSLVIAAGFSPMYLLIVLYTIITVALVAR